MIKSVSTTLLFFLASLTFAQKMDVHVPMGWAVSPSKDGKSGITGTDIENTIGGGNGKVVTAKSQSELSEYIKSKEPLVIMAEGSFSGIRFASNKTLIGVGSGATFSGSGTGLGIDKVHNVIVRNVKVTGFNTDAISVAASHHIWIDHCDLSQCGDGLLDTKLGSDNCTYSWIKFSNHDKNMLINHGQPTSQDIGRLNITLHHLWFEKTKQRNPRAGYGQIQILNCYYNSNSAYGIHCYQNAELVIERCFFTGVKDAISDHYRNQKQGDWPGPGYTILIDNKTDVSGSIMKENTKDNDRIFNINEHYMYDWVVTQDVEQVPNVVQAGAGTGSEWGKIGAIPTPGQGYTRVSTSPTLKWTKVGSKETNKVYFDKKFPPQEVATVNGYEYKPGNLDAGTVYYWKINDGDLWKFRTEGAPVSVTPKHATISKKSVKSQAAIKKGLQQNPNLFIGIQKGENHLYDLQGKERVKSINKSAKKSSK